MHSLPNSDPGKLWLSWLGMETDLIFNQSIDLPGFAAFPLLETAAGRQRITDYYQRLLDLGERHGVGICLDSVTWVANADRAAELGYDAAALHAVNRDAIALMADIAGDSDVCLTGQIGPRGDGYLAGEMTADAARRYHTVQIQSLATTKVALLAATTIGAVDEAIGLVQAATDHALPIAMGLTVETNGRLPENTTLSEAIDRIDQVTNGAAAYFVVNCAHPDHIAPALDGSAPLNRITGIIANASRASHAELDECETLDDGNPNELGRQLAELRAQLPGIALLGGCCGTDFRHLDAIARHAQT